MLCAILLGLVLKLISNDEVLSAQCQCIKIKMEKGNGNPNSELNSCNPILKLGSPFRNGDPHSEMGMPFPKWGCIPKLSPFWNGDPHFGMGIPISEWGSPFYNGDTRIPMSKL